MKRNTNLFTLLGTLIAVGAWSCPTQAAPGTITATASHAEVAAGDTFTVDITISGYTDTEEIDAWQVRLNWDESVLSYVSTTFDDGVGGDQWLLKSNQTTPIITPSIGPASGLLSLAYTDLKITDSFGTSASSGRLATVTLEVDEPGPLSEVTTGLTLTKLGSSILIEAGLASTVHADPTLVGTSIKIIPEPASWALLLGITALATVSRRRVAS